MTRTYSAEKKWERLMPSKSQQTLDKYYLLRFCQSFFFNSISLNIFFTFQDQNLLFCVKILDCHLVEPFILCLSYYICHFI